MEKNKYLEPKFSYTLYPLLKLLRSKYEHYGSSSQTSMISQS
jgi:hypothetical protein